MQKVVGSSPIIRSLSESPGDRASLFRPRDRDRAPRLSAARPGTFRAAPDERNAVQTLTIGAVSLESARGFFVSLNRFHAELVETADGRHEVRVRVYEDREIYGVLDAIERHVTERADGPARIDLDGRRYLIDAAVRD